ncbi:NRPS-like enzyme [Desarmillaria ectypa]|nr:NRPS-like enzyme [Desarmillaria ectypa]
MSLPTPQGITSLTLTFPEPFDYNATHSPKYPLFRYDDPGNDGFCTILWEEGVAAFHTAGHYFKKYVHGDAPVIVGILANTNSITYFAVLASLMRLGFIPFPISTRNSVAAIVHLMKSTDAKYLIVSQDVSLQNTADIVCRQFWEADIDDKINTIPMPHFSDLFSVKPGEYDLLPPVRPDWSQTALIIHSSGLTRFPSPIYTTYKNVLRNATRLCEGSSIQFRSDLNVPQIMEKWTCAEKCLEYGQCQCNVRIPSSIFSNCGVFEPFLDIVAGAIIASFPPVEPSLIPTAERLLSSIIATKTTLVFTVPSFLVEWARDPKAIEALKSTTAVIYGGGPLEKDAGDTLVTNGILSHIHLRSHRKRNLPGLAQYRVFRRKGGSGLREVYRCFMPTDEKDIYRLYVQESPHHSPSVLDMEIDGARALDANDLVQLHPSNRKLFKVYGRADDQIMHGTGEKTNPGPIEAGLTADKRIAAALMFSGTNVSQASSSCWRRKKHLTQVTLHDSRNTGPAYVNEQAPQHSRIYKEMILVAKPSKPFEFTAKGTLRRKVILKAYEQEIEDLYKVIDDVSQMNVVIQQLWTLKNVMTMIRDIVTTIFERKIGDTDDIFVAGGDSLTAMSIRNSVLCSLRKSKAVPVVVIRALPPNFVFDPPSIAAMSAFIHGIVKRTQVDFVSDRNIVKLRDGAGEPPSIAQEDCLEYAFYADKFRTSVWALTIIPETPLNSLPELASFYFAKIKAERTHGPYRFASYSSSSLLLVVLVKLFEDNGDEVAQAVMLDHFPTMFVYSANRLGNLDPSAPENIRTYSTWAWVRSQDRWIETPTATLQRTKNLLLDGWKDVYATDTIRGAIRNTKVFLTANAEFVYALTTDETGMASIELTAQWIGTVKVPITVVVVPEGALEDVREEDRITWTDLGTKRCLPDARVVFVKGGHYEFLTDEVVLQLLQDGYQALCRLFFATVSAFFDLFLFPFTREPLFRVVCTLFEELVPPCVFFVPFPVIGISVRLPKRLITIDVIRSRGSAWLLTAIFNIFVEDVP